MSMLRMVLAAGCAAGLSACAPSSIAPMSEPPPLVEILPPSVRSSAPMQAPAPMPAPMPASPMIDPVLAAAYASRGDGDWRVPAVDVASFDPAFLRQTVPYSGPEEQGTIVIDTDTKHLFLVEGDGTAVRYGVSVGREGFGWTGEGTIGRKARWPRWTPPPEMIDRDPTLEEWRDGMPGGPQNPLGARSLYIYMDGQDSLYRVHGTNEPRSIGRNASSGCFRMLNQDVIDLYARVEPGTRIVVR